MSRQRASAAAGFPAWPGEPTTRHAPATEAARRSLPAAGWLVGVGATAVAVSPLFAAFTGGRVVVLVAVSAVVAHLLPVLTARMAAPRPAGALARAPAWVKRAAGTPARAPAWVRRAAGAPARAPAWVSIVASVLAWAVVTLGFAVGHLGDGADLLRGLGEGPARLLSVTIPVSQPRWLLVVPVTLGWVTAAVAAELLRRWRPWPAVGARLLCFATALALTAGGPSRAVTAAVVLLALLGGEAVVVRWLATAALPGTAPAASRRTGTGGGVGGGGDDGGGDGRSSRPGPVGTADLMPARPLVVGGAAIVLAAVAVAVVVPRLPGLGGRPVAPNRRPPLEHLQPVEPTDAVAALRDGTPAAAAFPELSIRTSRPFAGYVAMAELDRYDGDTWALDRTFVPSGGRVPVPPGTPPGGRVITEDVHVLHQLPGPWLPVAGRPLAVSGTTIDYAPATAMVVPAGTLAAGATYTVRAVVPGVTLASMTPGARRRMVAADPADLGVPASVRPYLAAVVASLAAQAGTAPAPNLSFLAAILRDLQRRDSRLVSSPTAAGGSAGAVDQGGTSFAAVVHAVLTARQATPEQFATLFALVARFEGIPARVVTGFRATGSGHPVGGHGAVVLTDRQAWTWVQIPVVGLGWVVADPTPSATGTPSLPTASVPASSSAPSPSQAVGVSGHSGHALAAPVQARARRRRLPWWVVVAVAALLIVVAAVPVTVAVRRRRRRRRRRQGAPADQVVGAWHQVLDTLALARCTGLDPLTAGEVAAAAAEHVGPEAADAAGRVGRLADRALFSSRPVDVSDAELAWAEEERVRAACRQAMSRRQRVMAQVGVPARRG